ncbi:hypothetical protein SERLA73DRAFT_69227 [Serpula lacrymans var. lacrymans S7.3]|uniref:DUF6533 domain-containing protein n=1 Tax=Serpula lacrymans var. lacrymans (strain S7.3) TaxID=936435 RepID=F8PKK7_SERL3|nr:hypothetical protein SERLA73DRAFT_69227 [Serpula lacrymans var. lacrymans S7.3]
MSSESVSSASLNMDLMMILIPFSIIVYDYALTFTMEVERFWLRPSRTWPTQLFFVNRYLLIGGRIPMMVQATLPTISPHSSMSWLSTLQPGDLDTELALTFKSALMIMRVYALYDQSRRLLYALLVIAVAIVAEACWAIFSPVTNANLPITSIGCGDPLSSAEALRQAAAWCGQLAFDVIVFVLTLWKTWRVGSVGGRPLINILLRDGVLYFAVMSIANVINVSTFLLASPERRGSATGFANAQV